VCRRRQCTRLHLCFATVYRYTAGRSISRGRIRGIFGFRAASNHTNYLRNRRYSPPYDVSRQVCSGVHATTQVLHCISSRSLHPRHPPCGAANKVYLSRGALGGLPRGPNCRRVSIGKLMHTPTLACPR